MPLHLILFAKPGCHLCDEVRALLAELQPAYRFEIEEIDITSDAGLFARYRYEIPVVVADGREIARGRIDEQRLLARLREQS